MHGLSITALAPASARGEAIASCGAGAAGSGGYGDRTTGQDFYSDETRPPHRRARPAWRWAAVRRADLAVAAVVAALCQLTLVVSALALAGLRQEAGAFAGHLSLLYCPW